MKKLVMSAAILATLAAPAFAHTYQRQTVYPEQTQALRAQAYAPGWMGYSARAYAPDGVGYSNDNEHASMLSPGSTNYQTDYNR